MKNNLLVSIIMPAYNSERYIADAIASILKQTYKNIELIIVNDASTDETLSIINSFNDSRIKVLTNEKNSGVSVSLNKAIDAANGIYIARMDADDVALPMRIEMQVSFMEKHQDYGLCGTFARELDGKRCFYHLTKNTDIQVSLLFQNTFIHPTVMFRSNLIKKHKYSEKFNFCEDYELWSRLSRVTKLANLSKILLNYRVYDGSVSFTKRMTMEILRETVVKRLLLNLGILPTERELFLHLNLANVYDKKRELSLDKYFLSDLTTWVLFLVERNKKLLVYNVDTFCAIMLFRLFLSCYFLKNITPFYNKNVWKCISFNSFIKFMSLFCQKIFGGLFYNIVLK